MRGSDKLRLMSRSSFTQPNRSTRTLGAVACLAALALTLGACTSSKKPTNGDTGGALPAAADLMSKSETAMSAVTTVHFVLTFDGQLPGIPINSAQGDLTKAGDAKGTATVSLLGSNIETEFVIVNGSYYIKGPTGGFSSVGSAAAVGFDPSSILDPNRGIVKLMQTATGTSTQARESINGRDAYRVAATADPTTVASIIPGASGVIPGLIWIDATTYQVLQGQFTLPGSNGKTVKVTITLSNFDAPVTVNAP